MNKILIALFGAPGCGKGYLGDCIKEELINQNITTLAEFGYISTGDLLRSEVASNSPLGQQISKIMTSGQLVSDEIVNILVEKAINNEKKIIILDGYPRTNVQLEVLQSITQTADFKIISIKRDTPTNIILERISQRRICKDCKYTHSIKDGKCPKCGGESIIRKDDAAIIPRLSEYQKNTSPIWDKLTSISHKHQVVDGSQDAKEISQKLVATLFIT